MVCMSILMGGLGMILGGFFAYAGRNTDRLLSWNTIFGAIVGALIGLVLVWG